MSDCQTVDGVLRIEGKMLHPHYHFVNSGHWVDARQLGAGVDAGSGCKGERAGWGDGAGSGKATYSSV